MNYREIYNQIIKRAKKESRIKNVGKYYETHHIKPKCLGGSNSVKNIVLLTAKEHFLCHKLLVLIYPKEKKLIYALWMMSNGSNKFRNEHLIVSSKDYENHRQLFIEAQKEKLTGRVVDTEVGKKISKSKIGFRYSDKSKKKMSESQKGKIGEKNSFYGRKHTEDSKNKMSESAKKRKVTEETRKKMSKSRQGRKHTEESKKKMSENMKNIKRKTCVCDICQGIFSLSNINRHRNSCIIKNNVGDSH